jgi:fructose-1-phosphate kinase PfkB-like protein
MLALWLGSLVLVSVRAASALQMSGPIVVVGLNPALQRTITLSGLKVGGVNRASSVEVGIGGKGQNVIVASRHMQLQRPSQLLQFLGE